jgi:hypothetical protein
MLVFFWPANLVIWRQSVSCENQGAAVEAKNEKGAMALDVAKGNDCLEVVALLSDRMNESHHTQAATIAANNVATSGNSNTKPEAKINQVCYAWIKMLSRMCGKQTIHFPITHNCLLVTGDQSKNCV